MTATMLIENLQARGLGLRLNGERLVVAPSSQLTESDRQVIRQYKAEILTLLNSRKPRREINVQTKQMPDDCLWDTCKGKLARLGVETWSCASCGYLFRQKPLEGDW